MEYQRTVLPNGIRLLTSTVTHVRSVSMYFYFGVGSRYEEASDSGIAHMIEHMLFKGSERYPSAQVISETIEGVGGYLDAATDKEVTIFSAKVASRHFHLATELLADMVRHPRFEPEELEKERRVIIEELGMYRDSPADWVGVLADELLWPNLPLGREVAGTRETVQAMSLDAVRTFHRAHYVPSNLVISMAGDVTHEEAVTEITRLLGDWAPADAPRWTPCPPPEGTPRVGLDRRTTEQTNFALLMPGIARTDPDHYALILLNAILGDGMSSRIFLEVRERQGLAYDVSTAPSGYADTGTFGIYAGVEPERTTAALAAVLREVARIRDEPVEAEELERAREYTKGRIVLGLEDTGSIASWLGGQEMLHDEVLDLDTVLARYDAVTAEDVQRVARRLFQEDWLRLAVIGPHRDAAEFDQVLRLPKLPKAAS